MEDFEKLGAFYLGKTYDLDAGERQQDLLLYDSKDLCTHGVCVGMTGSGKTGLCLSLLEEAAIDGIPAICIDPKGDLGNLMLTFPDLKTSDFRPWIDEAEAGRKGVTPDEFAKKTANMWKKGLGEWGQDGDRIQKLRDAADVTIYTPGSSAGRQITVLRSFDAPPIELIEDSDAMRERVQSAVSGLLALLGIDADPVRSREHILLSNILDSNWREGRSLTLADIIGQIQKPGFDKVGVFDLESFYPAKDRFDLAIQMNGILASPGFANWLKGDALDIQNILYTPEGKPRLAIMSIAHLNDAERMFFVTILLNEMLAWMRTQAGTSSLRALLYMDEIFGYFPPTANPPSKQPMLTLLKQARAFGVGVMMATQNPVDLDYKGLSNCGTWFIGRLQTERDKMRVLDGLEGASAEGGNGFDRGRMEQILAGLGSRVFLMHNVHEDGPEIFQTRWAMSYLRGPMTRTHIETLMADKKKAIVSSRGASDNQSRPAAAQAANVAAEPKPSTRPMLTGNVEEYWLPIEHKVKRIARVVYRPKVIGTLRLHYASATNKIDQWDNVTVLADTPDSGFIDWDESEVIHGEWMELEREEPREADYSEPPAEATNEKYYKGWKKELTTHLYQKATITLYKSTKPKMLSTAGETEGAFRGRLMHAAREERDIAVEKLRQKYASKFDTLTDRIRRYEQKVEEQEEQYKSAKMSSMVNVGTSILGALLGRKKVSYTNMRRMGSAGSSMGRANKEKADIDRAIDDVEAQREKLADLEREFQDETYKLEASFDPDSIELTEVQIRPRKSDITHYSFGLVWTPWVVSKDGIAEPLFD